MAKRLICLIISVLMVVSLLPMGAFADETTYVAKIGETEYATLAEAIDAVVSGQTITLLSNVSVTDTLKIYKSITLDLGEYTITSTASDKALYTTQSLKITATTGGITATAGNAIVNQKGNGTGTLTIDGGTYESTASHAIYNNNGTVIVNSGTIKSTSETARDGICCYADATVTVNGGEISGGRYGIYSLGTLTITDGTVSGTKAGVYVSSGKATISGGTVKSDDAEGLKGTSDASISITGGTFSGKTHAVNVSSDTTVSGGTFTATGAKSDYAVAFYISGGTVTFSGGTFSGMYSTVWVKSGSEGSYTIADGCYVNTGTLTDNNSSESALVRVVLKNGYYLVEDYKSDSTYTYPTSDGKVFAGWYTDEDCDEVYTETSGVAYAKFVSAATLSVKGVVTSGTEADGDADTNYWRFVTGLDSFNYDYIGFQVKVGDSSEVTELAGKLYPKYTVTGADSRVFLPSEFGDAIYVATNLLTDNTSATTVSVRAYWTTLDGTTVYSDWYTFAKPSTGYELSTSSAE